MSTEKSTFTVEQMNGFLRSAKTLCFVQNELKEHLPYYWQVQEILSKGMRERLELPNGLSYGDYDYDPKDLKIISDAPDDWAEHLMMLSLSRVAMLKKLTNFRDIKGVLNEEKTELEFGEYRLVGRWDDLNYSMPVTLYKGQKCTMFNFYPSKEAPDFDWDMFTMEVSDAVERLNK